MQKIGGDRHDGENQEWECRSIDDYIKTRSVGCFSMIDEKKKVIQYNKQEILRQFTKFGQISDAVTTELIQAYIAYNWITWIEIESALRNCKRNPIVLTQDNR